jgi:putative membrane protein
MKKTIAVFAVIAAAAMLMAPVGSSAAPAMNGTEGGSGTVSKADRTFLVEAMQTDLMEVKSGEVAMKQGKSQSVVKLGEMLSRAHSALYAKGKKLASKLGVPVPKSPSAAMMAKMKALAATKGAAFDKAYTKMMVMGHEESIEKATDEIEAGSNKMVVTAAKQDLKIYEMHLRAAEKAMKEVG